MFVFVQLLFRKCWHWKCLCYCQRKVCILCKWFSVTRSSLTLTFYMIRVSSLFYCNPFSNKLWDFSTITVLKKWYVVVFQLHNFKYYSLLRRSSTERIQYTINEFTIVSSASESLPHSLTCIALQIKSIMHLYFLNEQTESAPRCNWTGRQIVSIHNNSFFIYWLTTKRGFFLNILRCGIYQSISRIVYCRV